MENEEALKERLKELRQDIYSKKKFGVDFSAEKAEADEIEKHIIDSKAIQINNEFISLHNWVDIHTSLVNKWDFIIYQNIVCKVLEMGTISYDEGMDTFNYKAIVKGVFVEEEFTFEFGYYETIKILNLYK